MLVSYCHPICSIPLTEFESFSGIYQCVVQSEHEEAQAGSELKLGDVAPLMLETFTDKQVVDSGSAVSLRCAAVGTPLPQIRWYLDDQTIPNLSRFRVGDHVTNDGKVVSFVNISNIRIVDGGEVSSNLIILKSKHIFHFSSSVLLCCRERSGQSVIQRSRSSFRRSKFTNFILGSPQFECGGRT